MLLVLIGESASGKSSIQKELCKNYGYKKYITFTSRPKREGEVDGYDYFFKTKEEMLDLNEKDEFIEFAEYNGWYYASPKVDVNKKNYIVVLTPAGLRKFKELYNDSVYSVYIRVDRRSRMINSLKRGDDIEEIYRRSVSDIGAYDGVSSEVNLVIDNTEYSKSICEISDAIIMSLPNIRK